MLFFATENSKQLKITYLQHISFTFIFFPFDVSFCFFSCFLFSFSFFSLVISALRAFLFFSCTFPLSHPCRSRHLCPVSVDLAALLPSSGIAPVQLQFTHFADLLRGTGCPSLFEHALKSAYCRVLFILSPKSGPRSDFFA